VLSEVIRQEGELNYQNLFEDVRRLRRDGLTSEALRHCDCLVGLIRGEKLDRILHQRDVARLVASADRVIFEAEHYP
jgi:hypothetical protein